VNVNIVRLLYQSLNAKVRLVLLTRHASDIHETLSRYRLSGLFDEIVHLRPDQCKADFITDTSAVFVDDSYKERAAVRAKTGIPTFDPTMVDVLLDDRL
jgi:hypothetical protein